MKFWRCDGGAAAVEFALIALPVFFFMFGIIQTAYIVWIDNLLHVSVNAAARCGGIKSITPPCSGSGATLSNMTTVANQLFSPLTGATFSANTANCSGGY